MKYVSKQLKLTHSAYFRQRMSVCTQQMTTHLVTVHQMFPLSTNNISKASVVENRKSQ